VLFTKVDRPHGIVIGPDKKVYVGEPGRVFRFDPSSTKPTREYVIGATGVTGAAAAMPIRKTHLHPLNQLLFLADGSLLVNFGSDSNNCAVDSKRGTCRAVTGSDAVGVVRRYRFDKPGGKVVSWSVMASGLRNSMAMAQHPSGTILQVENSRDAIDEADPKLSDELLPHDELNELVNGKQYGWPYCYDNQVNSPEFRKYACKSTSRPLVLLPAHSAPLGMTYWKGRLIVSYHGYRDTGHRLVSFPIDGSGRPSGPSTEILGEWAETDDLAPGGPVGVIGAQDGSLLVTDDRNGTLLRVTAAG
jgi:glucose/arabinose dehydrogenase